MTILKLEVASIPKEKDYTDYPASKSTLAYLEAETEVVKKLLWVKKGSEWGTCAIVCIGLWDQLRKPKALYPISVLVGEDEHVILRAKGGWAFDPTSEQFDEKDHYTYLPNPSRYTRIYGKLNSRAIADIREEGIEFIKAHRKSNHENKGKGKQNQGLPSVFRKLR